MKGDWFLEGIEKGPQMSMWINSKQWKEQDVLWGKERCGCLARGHTSQTKSLFAITFREFLTMKSKRAWEGWPRREWHRSHLLQCLKEKVELKSKFESK